MKLSMKLPGALLPLIASALLAAQEPLLFDDEGLERRFKALTEELRCLVCQNQNLADSDAPLAHDLRSEVFEMMKAGRSDQEIKQFLVDRYGDFVLYRPPLKSNTLVLWLAPAVLLAGGAAIVGFTVRKRLRLLEDDDEVEES